MRFWLSMRHQFRSFIPYFAGIRSGPGRTTVMAGGLALLLALVAGSASRYAPGRAEASTSPGHGVPARAIPPGPASHRRGLGTSCRSVAHIGDSTSVGMVSPAELPRRTQRLPARYAAVGVRHLRLDASGGRSILERLPGQVNGYQVARAWQDHGYRGCWVIALGTNDTSNVAVGSVAGRGARIAMMMSLAHGQPVLWVGTRTVRTSGPWSAANMRLWNHDLLRACARYPNLRVFGWSSVARRSWYLPDGIHYTRPGYAARARDIATALARAFGTGGPSRGCVVR